MAKTKENDSGPGIADRIPVLLPRLPRAENLVKYLKRIDETRLYTNFGPLVLELEKRLAKILGTPEGTLASICNGTEALVVMLRCFEREGESKKYCFIPAWTFVATAAAVVNAGYTPVLVDVDPFTWDLRPERCLEAAKRLKLPIDQFLAAIPVSPFGAPIELQSWSSFQKETGVRVLVDAAASFDSFKMMDCEKSRLAAMISLHATKVFGVGEGALVYSPDREEIIKIKRYSNFGFWGSRDALLPGVNAKLSEYVGAVGGAEADEWESKRAAWDRITKEYLKHEGTLSNHGIKFIRGYGQGWISSYCNVQFDSAGQKKSAVKKLTDGNIDFRDWWGGGIHRHPGYEGLCLQGDLAHTHALVETTLGLPFFTDLDASSVRRIVTCLTS